MEMTSRAWCGKGRSVRMGGVLCGARSCRMLFEHVVGFSRYIYFGFYGTYWGVCILCATDELVGTITATVCLVD